MKTIKNRIWLMFSLAALYLSFTSCFTSKSTPSLPNNTNALIEAVAQSNNIPDWHIGRLDSVCNEELCIHFESIGDEKNPTILLIMGYGTSGLAWTSEFIQPLLDASFHVVRFDNRDTGKSRWQEGKAPKGRHFYDLSDMAKDACRVLDKLEKEKAHIVGISMGGMIGQHLSINHPERVLTLTSLASTGYYWDPKLVSVSAKVIQENAKLMWKYGVKPKSFAKEVKSRVGTVAFLRNDEKIDEEMITFSAQRNLFKKQNDYINHPKANKRHGKAIRKSGSRLDQLSRLEMPVLLIHGTKDVLIWAEHTKKYAQFIKHKKEVYIKGMGHIPTTEEEERMSAEIIQFIKEQK